MKTLLLVLIVFLAACTQKPTEPPPVTPNPPPITTPEPPVTPEPPAPVQYIANWDKNASGAAWTKMVLEALDKHGADMMAQTVAKDANDFCPKFSSLTSTKKKQFYLMLVSSMAEFESSFKPTSTYQESFKDGKGNYVISTGLLQISQESGNGYGCNVTTEKLKDPKTNLECGVRILNRWIGRDSYLGSTVGTSNLGGARYWSVLRHKSSSRAKIAIKTKALSICN